MSYFTTLFDKIKEEFIYLTPCVSLPLGEEGKEKERGATAPLGLPHLALENNLTISPNSEIFRLNNYKSKVSTPK